MDGVETRYYWGYWGDVIGLLDNTGNQVVSYRYNSWGKLLATTDTTTEKAGTWNPFRYRGYCWDEETELYYVGSRYYDPEVCRFISPDTTDVLGASPMELTNKNLYAYCDNNPISREDEDGDIWNIVIGAAVGAVAGLVGQILSDVVTSVLNNEKLTFSNWQTYAGAILGGAIGGAVLGATGNIGLSNAVTGFATTGIGLSLEKATIKGYDKSWLEIAVNSAGDGAISYGLGKLPGIDTITAGRNSQSAVYRRGLTLLRKNIVSRMGVGVVWKGVKSSIVGGFCLDLYYGVKQKSYQKTKNIVRSWIK